MSNISLSLPTNSVQTILPDPPSVSRRPFLTPLPDLPGEALLVLDNTSLEKIKRCHQAARNYLVLGREPHAKNAALTFGGAIHEGLDRFHHWQYEMQHEASGFAPVDELMDMRCKSEAEQNKAIQDHFLSNPTPPDEYRTVTTALEVMKHYRRRCDIELHPDYEWEIMSDARGPLIERAFEIPMTVLEGEWFWNGERFTKIHLAWSGRIDLVARVMDRVRIVDNKTTSILGDQFVQGFQISSQTIGYEYAGNILWPDLGISGFCLNAIALKKPAGNVGLTERGPRGGDPALSFFRAYFDYSPERIAEWERHTILTIEDFLHSVNRSDFPLNDRSCFDKFGRCSYHDVCCIDDPRVRDNLLASDAFRQVTWNPVAGR